MRRPITALLAAAATLGVGATALAQGGEDRLSVDLQDGCLSQARVALRITPGDEALTALSLYANGREVLDLSGLTGEARMTVRLASARGRVTVTGELADGERFERSRDYQSCAPRPAPQPRSRPGEPEPTLTGGGEG